MVIHDGGYQLISGNGACWSVTISSGAVSPCATPGPSRGVIRVLDKTFGLSLEDEGVRLDEDRQVIALGGKTYPFTIEMQEQKSRP